MRWSKARSGRREHLPAAVARLVVVILLAALLPSQPPHAAAAPTVPAGFRIVDYPTGQAPLALTDFFFTPDGLMTSGKDGTITFLPSGTGVPRTVGTVRGVRVRADHGLLALRPAHDHRMSGDVYVSYDRLQPDGSGVGMVEVWRASPPSSPTRFTHVRTLLDGAASPPLPQRSDLHGIDDVVVAPDGSLYVTVGDDSPNDGSPASLVAQDWNAPHGKVLRLQQDGRGHPDNPRYDPTRPTAWQSRIFAVGFRNPFRAALNPRTGALYVSDVGWRRVEEINVVRPGGNHGWPCFEGREQAHLAATAVCRAVSSQPAQTTPPLHAYPAVPGSGSAVIGGAFYTGTAYPPQYRGAYFFGDYVHQRLWSLTTGPDDALTRAPEAAAFAVGIGGPVAVRTGPNGDITFADIYTGTVRRLVHQAGNRPPTASFTASSDPGTRTLTVDASASTDLDGDPLTFRWHFGDGATATGVRSTHVYRDGTPRTVTLTVTDSSGSRATSTRSVDPDNGTPTVHVQAPPAEARFAVDEPVTLSATATDPEDGALAVRWSTVFHHCPSGGACHAHPDGITAGATTTVPFPDHGPDVVLTVTATVEDTQGASATATYVARPRLRRLTLVSRGPVTVSGQTGAGLRISVVAGSPTTVSAPEDRYWRFLAWSDGGARTHGFRMPDTDLTLTARHETALDVYARGRPWVGPAVGREVAVAGGRERRHAAATLYWSARTGTHEVHGDILARYQAAGGAAGPLGFPLTDELAVPGGRRSRFVGGHVYWSEATGAREVHGAILAAYLAAGGPAGYGLPETDETATPDGRGRYNHFTGGRSVYWTPTTGARLVYGLIRQRWAQIGWERSCLGYPVTDEVAVSGGRRSAFEGGSITWSSATGQVTALCGGQPV